MAKLTPLMEQYTAIKSQYEDCILMYRLGDFYEMFLGDAVEAAEILQITLTNRNKSNPDEKMCGVPFHAVEGYIAKLTKAGRKVALCDQVSKPTGKGIVKREVVRVITPGTTFDENILDGKANNYVCAVVERKGRFGFAIADNTTGEFRVTEFESLKDLRGEIGRVGPAECVCGRRVLDEFFLGVKDMSVFEFEFSGNAEEVLKKGFEVRSLSVFGIEGKELAVQAAGALYSYLKETQMSELVHVRKVQYYENTGFMLLDEACVRNLELFYTSRDGKKEGSLNWVLDKTVCSMGGRLLRRWMIHPLLDVSAIETRLGKVEMFVKDSSLLRDLRDVLGGFYDIERLLGRLSIGTGNARDLVAMKLSLQQIPKVMDLISGYELDPLTELATYLETAIMDEPAAGLREGGMIREGHNEELDELRGISGEGKGFILQMQERESKRTGVSSLKVKYNKVFGYYIEISKANLDSVPEDYIRKQTLVNAERYITPELKEYEEKVLGAEDKIKELEYELFYEVRMRVVEKIREIQKDARLVAELDVLANFAFIAVNNDYVRPEFGDGIEIVGGRHPVIEQIGYSNNFVANDCALNSEQDFLLITGPNMGGKSTYLRQVALCVLMAQIGCFVPAKSAKLTMVDKIFTRVGASDNLVRGESTFMVEMQEASYILNNATERSLIILDEIGRGTSTYDGVSIAWAISEYVHNVIKAKTLFATHYHELTDLAEKFERGVNLSVAVRENEDGVVFLYKIVKGAVSKSYGIEVAKLAGLPGEIIGRAHEVLQDLEEKIISEAQLQLFSYREPKKHRSIKKSDNKFSEALKDVDIDNMTPLEALEKLSEIKSKFLSN